MQMIIKIAGIFTLSILFFFIVLFILYLIFKKDSPPFINPEGMPALRPLPIPTKNRGFIMRILIWFFDVRHWTLDKDWHFLLPNNREIILPEGFIFDGASIPRPFWFILSPVGLLLIPGLIHDYGYKYNQLWEKNKAGNIIPYKEDAGKKYWDDLFKEIGKEVNGFSIIDTIAWLGVKLGGYFAWKKHRKQNALPTKPV